MSKTVKTLVKIALPIAAGLALGPAGLGLTSAAVGGAIGGAVSGAIGGGGVKGAALGALTGYASSGVIGTPAGTTLAQATGNSALQGPTYGTGIGGLITGGGTRALTSTMAQAGGAIGRGGAGAVVDPLQYLSTVGNQLMAEDNAKVAKKAANTMSDSVDKAITAQAPYTQLGQNAANQITQIQADPAGYIQNNPLYTSLAADAERRLTAIQAAKGKLGSGGTASALQEQLLGLGTGIVNNQLSNLQSQVNTGANAASRVGDMLSNQGEIQAAGQLGANNAMVSGYQNQLNTLLALQQANRVKQYSPVAS